MNNCKLRYFGTPPNNDSVLITCSIFQLKNMYRNLDKYTNGLFKLIEYVKKLDYHILIYFDKSKIIHNNS